MRKFFPHQRISSSKKIVDWRMKECFSKDSCCQKKIAEPFTIDEKYLLWDKGVLGTQNPEHMINRLVFLIVIYFVIRGGLEYRLIKSSQYSIIPTAGSEREKLRFSGFVDKAHQGGLKYYTLGPQVVEHHAKEGELNKRIVQVFKK